MLKLYYARPSLYARPVWLALLEKQLTFELIPVDLGGQQFESDFLDLSPFGHIPVLVDGDFHLIESLAILDYLEAKYPQFPLLPADAIALAKVRMAQFVSLNELLPAIVKLVIPGDNPAETAYAEFRANHTLGFLENLLGDLPYFADEQLTLAELVAGPLVDMMPRLNISLTDYPQLKAWSERLSSRPAWQQVQLSPEEWSSFIRHMRVMPKIWQRRRRQRMSALS
ncbi:MAG: glutathione S-transferase family protein [Aphanocapsa sp. GSE-SYN-MK-11-07L]|jgi:glutathione S-transferase|nr:glutathione S-transferase family protein [Aphanocapsa sp. GSE-SYN-MK-11-07L]